MYTVALEKQERVKYGIKGLQPMTQSEAVRISDECFVLVPSLHHFLEGLLH